jgi:hypothetical protein
MAEGRIPDLVRLYFRMAELDAACPGRLEAAR